MDMRWHCETFQVATSITAGYQAQVEHCSMEGVNMSFVLQVKQNIRGVGESSCTELHKFCFIFGVFLCFPFVNRTRRERLHGINIKGTYFACSVFKYGMFYPCSFSVSCHEKASSSSPSLSWQHESCCVHGFPACLLQHCTVNDSTSENTIQRCSERVIDSRQW